MAKVGDIEVVPGFVIALILLANDVLVAPDADLVDRLAQRLLIGDSRSVILAEIGVGGNLVDTILESLDLVLNLGDGARRINSDDRRLGNLKTKLNVSPLDLVLQCGVAGLDRISSVDGEVDAGHDGGRVIGRNATVSDRVDGATEVQSGLDEILDLVSVLRPWNGFLGLLEHVDARVKRRTLSLDLIGGQRRLVHGRNGSGGRSTSLCSRGGQCRGQNQCASNERGYEV